MQTERELLELAAKAAGYQIHSWQEDMQAYVLDGRPWNPLTDDGDALRMAVRLNLCIDHNHPLDGDRWVMVSDAATRNLATEAIEDECGRMDATRRAIVRAAAEIGRNMP